jgi:hypothetical protein
MTRIHEPSHKLWKWLPRTPANPYWEPKMHRSIQDLQQSKADPGQELTESHAQSQSLHQCIRLIWCSRNDSSNEAGHEFLFLVLGWGKNKPRRGWDWAMTFCQYAMSPGVCCKERGRGRINLERKSLETYQFRPQRKCMKVVNAGIIWSDLRYNQEYSEKSTPAH